MKENVDNISIFISSFAFIISVIDTKFLQIYFISLNITIIAKNVRELNLSKQMLSLDNVVDSVGVAIVANL